MRLVRLCRWDCDYGLDIAREFLRNDRCEVQGARNQRVGDTGPYRFVRHPMYFGGIWYSAGVDLMLGSAAMAILAIPVFALAFLPRMLEEERILGKNLPGYADYMSRVRSRILPRLV